MMDLFSDCIASAPEQNTQLSSVELNKLLFTKQFSMDTYGV